MSFILYVMNQKFLKFVSNSVGGVGQRFLPNYHNLVVSISVGWLGQKAKGKSKKNK